MLNGKGMKKTTTSTGHSIWTKKCFCCERIKLVKHFPWYPMKVFDSAPRIMDACTKCAKVLHFRLYSVKDFSPDKTFLNKFKYWDKFFKGNEEADSPYDDRYKFNLGNGAKWK